VVDACPQRASIGDGERWVDRHKTSLHTIEFNHDKCSKRKDMMRKFTKRHIGVQAPTEEVRPYDHSCLAPAPEL
jgi:hypothetical protein